MSDIKKLIGNDANQVPRNRDLGSMAFQNSEGIRVGDIVSNTLRTKGSYVFGSTGTIMGPGNVNICTISFGAFTARAAKVSVLASMRSGPGGSRVEYIEQLVSESGSNTLNLTSLADVQGANMTITFNTSGNTLTINLATAASGFEESYAVSVEVTGGDVPFLTITPLV